MALEKLRTLSSGVEVSYWKISELRINWHERTAKCTLLGFINKQARDTGKDFVDSRDFRLKGEDFTFTYEGNNVAEAYAKIKEKDEWASAENV